MPTVWRIVPAHRVSTAFDGEGARLFGGRWNFSGIRMVYTSESRALAALEMLVHLTPETRNRPLQLIGIEIDPAIIEVFPRKKLPAGWQSPIIPRTTKQLGADWTRSLRSAVLQIPSVIIPEESNFLLNPAHPAFSRLRMKPGTRFSFDPRIGD